MSYHEYMVSREITKNDYPFYALIMATMRKADTNNQRVLANAFPAEWAELQARYHLPFGKYPAELTAAEREAMTRGEP